MQFATSKTPDGIPATTHCPKCSRGLKVRDEAIGKNVRCPCCQTVFVLQVDPLPVAERREVPPPVPTTARRFDRTM
jgi:hypothetical protein